MIICKRPATPGDHLQQQQQQQLQQQGGEGGGEGEGGGDGGGGGGGDGGGGGGGRPDSELGNKTAFSKLHQLLFSNRTSDNN